MLTHLLFENGLGNQRAFFIVCQRFGHFYLLSGLIFGPDLLVKLEFVLFDDIRSCIHDIFGGSVILFQFINLEFGIIFLEIEDVLNISAPECVDTLCVVAYHADVTIGGGEFADNQVLDMVGILVLIHHYVAEFLLVFVQHIRIVLEKLVSLKQQIIKVHGACLKASLHIQFVQQTHLWFAVCDVIGLYFRIVVVLSYTYKIILCHGYLGKDCTRFVYISIDTFILDNGFD